MVKLYGDGAYDSEELFEALADAGAEAAIRIRGSARPGRRGEEVRLRLALGYGDWASLVGYGMRWIVEAFFSAVKRKFGGEAEGEERHWAPSGGHAALLGVRYDDVLRLSQGRAPM
ncbi:MAG: transposase [Conexivisphaera sp.]